MKRPAVAAAVLLSTYAIEQFFQSRSAWFYERQTHTNYMCAFVMVWALFVRFARGERTVFPFTREFWTTFAIYVWAGITTAWSVHAGAWDMYKGYLPVLGSFGFLLPLIILRVSDLKAFI